MTAQATPAALYLSSLSEGSQGMRHTLDIIAGILPSATTPTASRGSW